jgi:hypothetical protein
LHLQGLFLFSPLVAFFMRQADKLETVQIVPNRKHRICRALSISRSATSLTDNGGGCMNKRQHQLYRVRLWLAVSTLILFSLCAAIAIVVWLPILPEAAAVTIDADSSSQWSQYFDLHQSWRDASTRINSSNSCPR